MKPAELVKHISETPHTIRSVASPEVLVVARGNNYLAELLWWIIGLTVVVLIGVLV